MTSHKSINVSSRTKQEAPNVKKEIVKLEGKGKKRVKEELKPVVKTEMSTASEVSDKHQKREYRKLTILSSFPWLCEKARPPGHMTLLKLENVHLTPHEVEQINLIKRRYDHPFRRTAIPKPGQSYLWCPNAKPSIDPEGPIKKMYDEIVKVIPAYKDEILKQFSDLHVSSPMTTKMIHFNDLDIKTRHGDTKWMKKNKQGYELPLILQFVAHYAPIPENLKLFNYLLKHGLPADAQTIAETDLVITGSAMARELIPHVGNKREALIKEYFMKTFGSDDDVSYKKSMKRIKSIGRVPEPGHGAGSHVMDELSVLPLKCAAPPCIEISKSGENKGKGLHVRHFQKATIHGRKEEGKVDPRIMSLEDGIQYLEELQTEPPGLRYLTWNQQMHVLKLCKKPTWDVNTTLGKEMKQNTDNFFQLFDALMNANLTKGQIYDLILYNYGVHVKMEKKTSSTSAAAADVKSEGIGILKPHAHQVRRSMKVKLEEGEVYSSDDDSQDSVALFKQVDFLPMVLKSMLDKHDMRRFYPLPYKPALYFIADVMMFGALPSLCPLCACRDSLLGSPSGWTSCKGWISKSKDFPCTFQTDKRLEYPALKNVPTSSSMATSGSGQQHLPRSKIMAATGEVWKLPKHIIPASTANSLMKLVPK